MGKGRQLLQGMNVPKVSINWRGIYQSELQHMRLERSPAAGSPRAQVPSSSLRAPLEFPTTYSEKPGFSAVGPSHPGLISPGPHPLAYLPQDVRIPRIVVLHPQCPPPPTAKSCSIPQVQLNSDPALGGLP